MILDLFLAVVDLTSVKGFAFNFYLVLFFETTGSVFIFVSVISSNFNKLPLLLTVGVTRKIPDKNASYSKLSKTSPLSDFSLTVLKKDTFKGKNTNSQKFLMFELVAVSISYSVFVTLLSVGFVSVCRMILGKEVPYYKLSKTVHLTIISQTFIDK